MEFRAIHRYAPMSGRKARPLANMLRGLGANEALEALLFEPQRASALLTKVLKSAIANAGQEGGVEAGRLRVKSAIVNDGPLKQGRLRFRPAPMGRAMPIRKRTCHIEVVLEVMEKAGTSGRKGGTKNEASNDGSGED